MANKWILHIKEFAKKHNISYACALSHPNIKDDYVKVVKKTKKQINDEKIKLFVAQNIEMLKNKIKNMDPDDKPIIRMKVKGYNQAVQDGLRDKYPKYWDKLFD